MEFQFILCALSALLAVCIAWLVLRRRARAPRKVVLAGKRGAGKTRLFLALSQKEKKDARTFPTLEAHTERTASGALLIDTPGTANFESVVQAHALGASDVVLYLFRNPKDPEFPAGPFRVIRVCTEEGAAPESLCDIAVSLEKGGVDSATVKKIASMARL